MNDFNAVITTDTRGAAWGCCRRRGAAVAGGAAAAGRGRTRHMRAQACKKQRESSSDRGWQQALRVRAWLDEPGLTNARIDVSRILTPSSMISAGQSVQESEVGGGRDGSIESALSQRGGNSAAATEQRMRLGIGINECCHERLDASVGCSLGSHWVRVHHPDAQWGARTPVEILDPILANHPPDLIQSGHLLHTRLE